MCVTTRLDVKRERVIRGRVDAHDVVDVVGFGLARLQRVHVGCKKTRYSKADDQHVRVCPEAA